MLERTLSRGFLLALAVVLLSASLVGQTTVVRAARLLDVASGEIRRPGVIVIEGDRIRGVNPTTIPPEVRRLVGEQPISGGVGLVGGAQCAARAAERFHNRP